MRANGHTCVAAVAVFIIGIFWEQLGKQVEYGELLVHTILLQTHNSECNANEGNLFVAI